jgi:hypothetical protein
MNIRVSITLMNPRTRWSEFVLVQSPYDWLGKDVPERAFFFLWKFAYHPTALGSYVLSSGPNTGRGAKDTYSEQVMRRVPKKIRDFIQGLRSHSGKG